jgi:hypothetical protein
MSETRTVNETPATDSAGAAAPAGLLVEATSLGGGPLARAALAGALPQWVDAAPASPDGWRARAEAVRAQYAAGAWLELLAPAFGARGRAAERLARVASGAGWS